MELRLKNRIAKQLTSDLEKIHVEVERHSDYTTIDLSTLTQAECERLERVFQTSSIQGTKVLAADIRKYIRAAEDGVENVRARTVRQAAWMLEHFFARLENHIIFSEDDYEGGSHSGYFVADVRYEPEKEGSSYRDYEPEHVVVNLVHVEDDTRIATELELHDGDVLEMTPAEILRKQGYIAETSNLMRKLERETILYYEVREQIGKQFVGRGIGLADLDSATDEPHYIKMSGSRNRVRLDNFGVESRVVIDVLFETDSERKDRRNQSDAHVNLYRWHQWNMRFFSPSEDDLVRHLDADEDTVDRPNLQIPVHPLVPVFDLRRHLRMRVHVNNLEPYAYRREVAENLVLPDRDWKMVNLLIDQSRNTFQDVVAGKGQSLNILSGGPPGTGKTVTAEVFSEFKERPLYTVQCSQLGLNAAEVQKNLTIILARANRWNAVLLLDEADVYIRRRGEDLQQNAIVGAFLQVLEYASCILFMTTNLPDDVDDAIASRCIVRLRYGAPTPEMQIRIWKALAGLNGVEIADEDIHAFAKRHSTISGRDVKNLLKLSCFIAESEKKPVDLEGLEYALGYMATFSTGAYREAKV